MGLNNPDLLYPKLEELVDHVQIWNERASEMVNGCEQLQAQASDHLLAYGQRVALAKNQIEEDEILVDHARHEVKSLMEKCSMELKEVHQLKSETEKVIREGKGIVAYWEGELQAARDWLARAQERLRLAEIDLSNAQAELMDSERELRSAEYELESAQNQLRSAQAALSNCQNSYDTDREGRRVQRDCSGYAAAVSQAQARVSSAYQHVQNAKERVSMAHAWVSRAIEERNGAVAEVKAAEARVAHCESALNIAEEGVAHSQSALNQVLEALSLAERSNEEAHAAEYSQKEAALSNHQQKEILDMLFSTLSKAKSAHDDARQNQFNVVSYANTAQNLASNGVEELGIRMDYLKRFAQPINFVSKVRMHVGKG